MCAAFECIAAALTPRDRAVGWVVAPTYDLADRVFREVELIALTHLKARVKEYVPSQRRLVLINLGGGLTEIRAKSADNPVSLLGEGLDFLVVDEAARLQPHIWQSHLSQRLIDKQGWALLISTPRGKGYLFDLYRRGRGPDHDPQFESWNLPSWTNPHLDRAVIEEERSRQPSRVFEQEFAAQFIEGAGAVFRNVRECAIGEWADNPPPYDEYFAGLDLAKTEDFTVLVVMNRDKEVVFVDRFHRLDWGIQATRIAAAARRFHGAKILCDVTGVGDPVRELLVDNGCDVDPYPFSARSKSALIKNLAMHLEQNEIVLPRPELWPVGIDELEAFEYSVTDKDNLRMSAPSGMHDDCVIALALATWAVSRPRAIVRVSVISRRKRRGRWIPVGRW